MVSVLMTYGDLLAVVLFSVCFLGAVWVLVKTSNEG